MLVMLAIADADARATYAYELAAAGFDVTVTAPAAHPDRKRPDVILAALSAQLKRQSDADGIPVVGVAADISPATLDLARRRGCAAICLNTCPAGELAAGLRAVIERETKRA
jgi:NAD(P)-dependent dehydrogenase (short-subunit alcohol dehydrogenase family)